MRQTNIGPGELTDRLTILALKIAYGTEAGKDVAHFVNERNVLLVQLRSSASDGWLEQLFELSAVNSVLWHAEDRLREYRRLDSREPEALSTAYLIQRANDRRAELVREINARTGGPSAAEKL